MTKRKRLQPSINLSYVARFFYYGIDGRKWRWQNWWIRWAASVNIGTGAQNTTRNALGNWKHVPGRTTTCSCWYNNLANSVSFGIVDSSKYSMLRRTMAYMAPCGEITCRQGPICRSALHNTWDCWYKVRRTWSFHSMSSEYERRYSARLLCSRYGRISDVSLSKK